MLSFILIRRKYFGPEGQGEFPPKWIFFQITTCGIQELSFIRSKITVFNNVTLKDLWCGQDGESSGLRQYHQPARRL